LGLESYPSWAARLEKESPKFKKATSELQQSLEEEIRREERSAAQVSEPSTMGTREETPAVKVS
jgi:hypothetical protein